MGFDIQKFRDAQFVFSEIEVPVPDLIDFFGGDSKPVFKLRNLTGNELAKVNEAVKLNSDLSALIDGLVSGDIKEKVDSIKEVIGISDKTDNDLVRRHAILACGSVDPQLDQSDCVRLADAHPVTFFMLTNKVLELTGNGKKLGE